MSPANALWENERVGEDRTPPRVVCPHPGVPTLVPTCHSEDQEGGDCWDVEGAGSEEEEEKDGLE